MAREPAGEGLSSTPRTVELVHPSYQPSKAELEEDLPVDVIFEEAVQALVRPVKVRYVKHPKRRR